MRPVRRNDIPHLQAVLLRKKKTRWKKKNTDVYVGNKYIILDSFTGQNKPGEYFCLKLNSKDPKEQEAVRAAMSAYSAKHRSLGNSGYANRVDAYYEKMSLKS